MGAGHDRDTRVLTCTDQSDGLESHLKTLCGEVDSSVNGLKAPAKGSVMPALPARGAKSPVADDPLEAQNRAETRKLNGRISRAHAGHRECLEKICKHVRHGQNAPRQLDKVKLTCY